MTVLTARRCVANLALVSLFVLATAEPALAQSSGAGGNIGTFIQNIIDILNSNVIRGLVARFNHLDRIE